MFVLNACSAQPTQTKPPMDNPNNSNPVYSRSDTSKVAISTGEWKKILSPELYYIAREKGTERPYTSIWEKHTDKGTYYCAACGNALFQSDTKFDDSCFVEHSVKIHLYNVTKNSALVS